MCVGSRAVAGGSLQECLSVRHLGLDHDQTRSGTQLIHRILVYGANRRQVVKHVGGRTTLAGARAQGSAWGGAEKAGGGPKPQP